MNALLLKKNIYAFLSGLSKGILRRRMKSLLTFFLHYQKTFFLVLTMAVGLFIFFPIHNIMLPLAQGDHGRDLYAFTQTMQGQTPYQDYLWTYGPLMPYYYGFIFKILGPTIQAAICGEIAVKLLTIILFYLALGCFVPFLWASIGALWFASFYPHFSHTFNHAGCITALLFLILNLFLYLKTQKQKFLMLGFFAAVIVSLIKINFGVTGFLAFFISAAFIDLSNGKLKENLKTYIYGSLLTGISIFLIHLFFIRKLPFYYILQCFSVLKNYQQAGYAPSVPIGQNITSFLQKTWTQNVTFWPYLVVMIVVLSLLGLLAFLSLKAKDQLRSHKNTFLILASTSIFVVLSLHEAFLSERIYAKYWGQPFQILFVFLVIGIMIKKVPHFFQIALAIFLCAVLLTNTQRLNRILTFFKSPIHRFQVTKNDVYITNSADWFLTVHQTVSFLNNNLKEDELFFALPYETLYYFLTNKKSPTRELYFFTFVNITPEQEKEIISRLETKKVNYIVLSNRCQTDEAGMGTFGKDYCPLLAQYILEHFSAVESFGDWNRPAGWIDNHAVKILKRKNP
jgi:hypothetical protein